MADPQLTVFRGMSMPAGIGEHNHVQGFENVDRLACPVFALFAYLCAFDHVLCASLALLFTFRRELDLSCFHHSSLSPFLPLPATALRRDAALGLREHPSLSYVFIFLYTVTVTVLIMRPSP